VNRKVLLVVLTLAVFLLVTPYVGGVYATKPLSVSFTSTGTGVLSSVARPAGESDNVITEAVHNLAWTGDFEGTCIMEVRLVFHEEGYNYQEIVTFTGTVSGEHTGTLTIVGGQGNWRIIGGTGELSNLHGQGKMELTGIATFTFTGQVHFDP